VGKISGQVDKISGQKDIKNYQILLNNTKSTGAKSAYLRSFTATYKKLVLRILTTYVKSYFKRPRVLK
jgi:hypothetical protein